MLKTEKITTGIIIMPLTPDRERLYQIFHPFAAAQQASAFSKGTRFVYYTRAETAMCILKNAQIWMRKSMCMNDFMEVRYGMQCLNDAFQSDVGTRFKSVLDRLFEGLQPEIGKLLADCMWHLQTDTYVTCVSEHKDEEDTLGRLPMWRAYGGTNGVAAPFQATEPSDVLKIYGSPVVYFDPQKFTEKFGEVVSNIENEADFIKQQDREEMKGRILRMLAFAAVCTKHPGFAEEVEWRIIHFPWWESSTHMIKGIEVIGGVPQPVYKIPLKDIPEAGLFGITIPTLISRIIVGPTRDPLAIVEALADLLAKAGVEQPYKKICISNIPLRQ